MQDELYAEITEFNLERKAAIMQALEEAGYSATFTDSVVPTITVSRFGNFNLDMYQRGTLGEVVKAVNHANGSACEIEGAFVLHTIAPYVSFQVDASNYDAETKDVTDLKLYY